MSERLLYECTDGDTSCGEYFNCIPILKRIHLPCGDKSLECLVNAERKGEKRRKTLSELKLEIMSQERK